MMRAARRNGENCCAISIGLQQKRLQHRGADWLVARTDEANDQCHLACLDRHRSVRADREADIGLRKFGAIVGAVP